MNSREQIARDVLAAQIHVEYDDDPNTSEFPWRVYYGRATWSHYREKEAADRFVENTRAWMLPIVMAALEQCLAVPLPETNPARVQELLESYRAEGLDMSRGDLCELAHRLCEEVDLLKRMLLDTEEGGMRAWSQSYKDAFAAGAKAQQQAICHAMNGCFPPHIGVPTIETLMMAVLKTPLVTLEDAGG